MKLFGLLKEHFVMLIEDGSPICRKKIQVEMQKMNFQYVTPHRTA